jgi:GT2 family glycosyltransferase
MSKPKVSVIVTNYNYGQYLFDCVKSIRNQTHADYELVIVDDGSTDGSAGAVPHLADVAVLLSKNSGTHHASNVGVRASSGQYCVLVNADDLLDPKFIEACVNTLDNHADAAFTYTDFWHFGQSGDKTFNNGVVFQEWNKDDIRKFNYILCSAMFRRQAFDAVGGFRVDYGLEDYDLWLRMSLNGFNGKRTPGYLYKYRAHEKNRSLGIDTHQVMERIKAENLAYPEQLATKVVPRFSLCYATKRHWEVSKTVSTWLAAAEDPGLVEVIICTDSDDLIIAPMPSGLGVTHVVQDQPPHNSVKAWNLAATRSSGQILIAISDDFEPMTGWDTALWALCTDWPNKEAVIRVNDGNTSSANKPFTLPILTRKRYERLGYMFYPEYESLFSDTEFGEHAELDGVVINAKTLLFEHHHHTCFKRSKDSVDDVHSSDERWYRGEAIYSRRKASNFMDARPERPLADVWVDYTQSVRTVLFTISLEAAMWLEYYIRQSSARTALDLGANFESYVFSSCGLTTTLLDVGETRELAQTQLFLSKQGLKSTKGPLSTLGGEYDIVFVNCYPAESIERQQLTLHVSKHQVAKGGTLILNDGHFSRVRKTMDMLAADGWTVSTPSQTFDSYDRFLMVLKRRDP